MPRPPASSREELDRIQLAKLRELLGAVRPDNAFYETKLGPAGIDDSVASLAVFRANCPFTTKTELAADHADNPPYGSNLTFPLGRYTRVHQTSGTSGAPLRWPDTPESWQWMIDNWCDIFRAAGVSCARPDFFCVFVRAVHRLLAGVRGRRGAWRVEHPRRRPEAARRGCGPSSPTGPTSSAARRRTPCAWPKWPRRKASTWPSRR